MKQKIFGLDLDENFIDYCKHKFKGHSNCEFIAGDIFKDEFNFSEKPDSIMCMNVFEHIEDDNAALKWMNGSVTDDGNLVLLVPSHPCIYGAIDEAAGHFLRYAKKFLSPKLKPMAGMLKKLFTLTSLVFLAGG